MADAPVIAEHTTDDDHTVGLAAADAPALAGGFASAAATIEAPASTQATEAQGVADAPVIAEQHALRTDAQVDADASLAQDMLRMAAEQDTSRAEQARRDAEFAAALIEEEAARARARLQRDEQTEKDAQLAESMQEEERKQEMRRKRAREEEERASLKMLAMETLEANKRRREEERLTMAMLKPGEVEANQRWLERHERQMKSSEELARRLEKEDQESGALPPRPRRMCTRSMEKRSASPCVRQASGTPSTALQVSSSDEDDGDEEQVANEPGREYDIEAIIDDTLIRGIRYLKVSWMHYGRSHDDWQPHSNFNAPADDVCRDFWLPENRQVAARFPGRARGRLIQGSRHVAYPDPPPSEDTNGEGMVISHSESCIGGIGGASGDHQHDALPGLGRQTSAGLRERASERRQSIRLPSMLPPPRPSGGQGDKMLWELPEDEVSGIKFALLFENVYPTEKRELNNFSAAMLTLPWVRLNSWPQWSTALRDRVYITNLRGHVKPTATHEQAAIQRRDQMHEMMKDVLRLEAMPMWYASVVHRFSMISTKEYESPKVYEAVLRAKSINDEVKKGSKAIAQIKGFNLVPVGARVNQVEVMPAKLAERVMGFPDGHTLYCGRPKARREALGNSVDVRTIEYLLSPLPTYPRVQQAMARGVGITVFSVCDGIGGIPLAIQNVLTRADESYEGIRKLVVWEIDEDRTECVKHWWTDVLKKPVKNFVNEGSLTTCEAYHNRNEMIKLCKRHGFPHATVGG